MLEEQVIPRTGVAELCEDGIVVTRHFAAVIDGMTDKTGSRYDGMSGGRYVMRTLTAAITDLDPNLDAHKALCLLTDAVDRALPAGLTSMQRPAASVTMFSATHREIWQVGDVGFRWKGRPAHRGRHISEQINADMRAAYLTSLLLTGSTREELLADDPGRRLIQPMLEREPLFINNPDAGPFAYPAVNGLPVPEHLLTVEQVPDDVHEIIMASDGYPRIKSTLAESEEELKRLLAQDPLCIDGLRGTKGLKPGNLSYDDRSYLRLSI